MTTQSKDSTDSEGKFQVLPNWFCGVKQLSRALNSAQGRLSRIFGPHIWSDVGGTSIPALSPHLSKRNGASSGTGFPAERGKFWSHTELARQHCILQHKCILQYRMNVSNLVIPRYRFCGKPRILLSDNQQRLVSNVASRLNISCVLVSPRYGPLVGEASLA